MGAVGAGRAAGNDSRARWSGYSEVSMAQSVGFGLFSFARKRAPSSRRSRFLSATSVRVYGLSCVGPDDPAQCLDSPIGLSSASSLLWHVVLEPGVAQVSLSPTWRVSAAAPPPSMLSSRSTSAHAAGHARGNTRTELGLGSCGGPNSWMGPRLSGTCACFRES
jgi:hypothetical protein